MTRPITGAVLGVMWRRILERLFPKLRPALKAPEELAPDYPDWVTCAINKNGFPVCGWDGENFYALASLDPDELSRQCALLKQVNYDEGGRHEPLGIQLIHIEKLIDKVKEQDGITGIAVCGGSRSQIIYTR